MMKINLIAPKVQMPGEVVDLSLIRVRIDQAARRRAHEMAGALNEGLQEAAKQSFPGIKEDASSTQFVAHEEEPHSRVGKQTVAGISVEGDPPSGRDPDTVVGAFEYGSNALGTPATNFTRRIEVEQAREAKKDLEGIERE